MIHGTVTMLGDDNLRHTNQGIAPFVFRYLIIFRTMNEAYHVGVLLNGAGLAQIGQLGTLSLRSLPGLYATVQLRQSNCDKAIIGIFSSFAKPFNEREMVLTSCSRLPKFMPLAFISCR